MCCAWAHVIVSRSYRAVLNRRDNFMGPAWPNKTEPDRITIPISCNLTLSSLHPSLYDRSLLLFCNEIKYPLLSPGKRDGEEATLSSRDRIELNREEERPLVRTSAVCYFLVFGEIKFCSRNIAKPLPECPPSGLLTQSASEKPCKVVWGLI